MGVRGVKVDDLVGAFRDRFGAEPEVVARAPGRVNLLGAHVDYSEGWVLPAAIDRSVWVAARRASGSRTRLAALDFSEEASFDAADIEPPVAERGGETSWSDYPQGLAWALAQRGIEAPAIEAAFGGDLPIGAGVSSSAAVEMAFLLAWEQLAGFHLSGIERAQVGRQVENGYVGVQSGIMDQFASVFTAARDTPCCSTAGRSNTSSSPLPTTWSSWSPTRASAAPSPPAPASTTARASAPWPRTCCGRTCLASPPSATWRLPTSTGCSTCSNRHSTAAPATWSPSAGASLTARRPYATATCTRSAT